MKFKCVVALNLHIFGKCQAVSALLVIAIMCLKLIEKPIVLI